MAASTLADVMSANWESHLFIRSDEAAREAMQLEFPEFDLTETEDRDRLLLRLTSLCGAADFNDPKSAGYFGYVLLMADYLSLWYGTRLRHERRFIENQAGRFYYQERQDQYPRCRRRSPLEILTQRREAAL